MKSLPPLHSFWRHQLYACENEAQLSPGRQRWLTDVRIRLYRFLLSFYRQGTWGAPPCPTDHHSPVEFVNSVGITDPPVKPSGTPPKSLARIRATIKSLHQARDNAIQPGPYASGIRERANAIQPGPYASGIRDDAGIWVAIGIVRRKRSITRRIRQRLDDAGIPCRIETIDRYEMVVRVPLPFKDKAREPIRESTPSAPINFHIRSDPFYRSDAWQVAIPIAIVTLVWLIVYFCS